MWIIPNNLPGFSPFARGCVDSNADLSELLDSSEPSLLLKSKPLSYTIFCRGWKRVYWIRHLSGQIVKPSTQIRFAAAWTSLWADTPVSHSATPDCEMASMIQDTYGRICEEPLASFSRLSVFSKTYMDTLPWGPSKLFRTYAAWATALRRESLQRQRSVIRTTGKDCLSWPTATVMEQEQEPAVQQARAARLKEKHNGLNGTKRSGNGCGQSLGTAVKIWPTALARDFKSAECNLHGTNSRPLNEVVLLHDRANPNTIGKNRAVLNPAWVAQLMGTTSGRIFFVD